MSRMTQRDATLPSSRSASLPGISPDDTSPEATHPMDHAMHKAPLRLGQRLRVATGLLLWGGAECLALWRSRRRRQRRA